MSEKNINTNTIKKDLSVQPDQPFSFLTRPAILSLTTFVILAFLFSLLIYQRVELFNESKIKEATELATNAKEKLQVTLTHSLSATKTLSFFIDENGDVRNFDSIASQIIETGYNIDAIQLVPDGIIQYVYPLKENETVIGYDILKDTTRNKEALKAIEKKEIFFAGPFELKQGGMGIVGRLPVFRKNKFWGFSAVVIKMATLFKAAGIDSTKNGYSFQLSKINPDTKVEESFLPVYTDIEKGISVSVHVPNGEWKLSVNRLEPYSGSGDIALLAILGFLLSLFGALFTYRIAIRPKKLDRLVKEQTIHLQNSENKYRSVIERVSDAFVALDKNWTYTYVNEKAGELIARDPKSLIGKNIWSAFPEAKGQPFYHAYYKAMTTQEYQFLEEYYPPYNKWFENHIYPSKDGLTIFFKDTTDIKLITLALKENEEKYRSLIEQASDGIVITDLEGVILEVNNSIKKMVGYDDEVMTGHHLKEFLPEEDKNIIPLRINELMQGKSLLYERRLLKKDGSILEVEINSKMASTQTLIGFIRDITERKRSEEALRKSNERFELIAEATNDYVWDIDLDKNITWGNTNYNSLYGIDQEPGIINFELFISHVHPDDRERVASRIKQAIDSRKSSITVQFRFKNASGDYKVFYDRALFKYDETGKAYRILGAMQDITEVNESKELLQKSYEDIRLLASNLQSIREDERTNIAREIHDELGQQLTGLKMDLHWLAKRINSTDIIINKKMSESIELINATISSVRKISTDLRPSILDDLGLVAALEWQSEEFEKRSGTRVEFNNETNAITVKPEVSTALFRIYQELLTNIARHANANLVTALLQKENNSLIFKVTDNGTGFNLASIGNKKTLGLLGIRERTLILGGTYEFNSNPGEGSETIITIPVNI